MLVVSDVDDCLNELVEVTIQKFEELTGGTFDRTRFNGYDLKNYLSDFELSMFDHIWSDPDLYDQLKPIAEAQSALKKLQNNGFEICMATRFDTNGGKKRWLHEHFSYLDEKNYFVTERKDLISCDFMIEDCIETLASCKPSTYRICIDKPWNALGKNYDEAHGIVRVNNITEACNKIIELAEKEED
jgi:5'(3')-deoxyribonucleotidase